jgi:hypothetical protein
MSGKKSLLCVGINDIYQCIDLLQYILQRCGRVSKKMTKYFFTPTLITKTPISDFHDKNESHLRNLLCKGGVIYEIKIK